VADELAADLGDYPALGRRAAERIPDAELVALDDVGHVPHFEAFDRFIETLKGFLAGR
ncbi:MAG: alpha/beta fold hydrolase, partial [Thiohalorhabdaceae bacterium]